VTFTLIEPDLTRQPGQIDEFLDGHGGAGVQHLAFRTKDIAGAIAEMSARGVEFLTAPADYFASLQHRLGTLAPAAARCPARPRRERPSTGRRSCGSAPRRRRRRARRGPAPVNGRCAAPRRPRWAAACQPGSRAARPGTPPHLAARRARRTPATCRDGQAATASLAGPGPWPAPRQADPGYRTEQVVQFGARGRLSHPQPARGQEAVIRSGQRVPLRRRHLCGIFHDLHRGGHRADAKGSAAASARSG
jgi:hypothetical protein